MGWNLTLTTSIKNPGAKGRTQKVESVAGKIREKNDGEETDV